MNEKLFLYINHFAGQNRLLDSFMIFSAQMPYLFILFEVYLYFITKKKRVALFAFYSVLASLLINKIVSLFYFHNRPFMDGIGKELIYHQVENSFPSDHTTFLFAIAFSFLFFKLNRFSSIAFLLAILGAIARVYVGVHYPYDILGGVISGLIGATIIYYFQNRFLKINEIIFKIEKTIFRGKNE